MSSTDNFLLQILFYIKFSNNVNIFDIVIYLLGNVSLKNYQNFITARLLIFEGDNTMKFNDVTSKVNYQIIFLRFQN